MPSLKYEPKGDTWFDGKPETLRDTVLKCEGYLAQQRFLDGVCRRAYEGAGLLPLGTSALGAGQMVGSSGIPSATSFLNGLESMAVENVLRSVLDGAAAQIVRPPRFAVMTQGASWKKQYAGRKIGRLLTGLASATGLEAAMAPCLIDAMTTMVAFTVWDVARDGKVTCERGAPHEFSWNPAEGPSPRTLCRRNGVPRRALMRRFPEEAAEIEEGAPTYRPPLEFFLDDVSVSLAHADMVEVCTAWRRAEGDDKGRFVMTCGDIVLANDEWELPFWAAVPLRWSESYGQFGGVPLARQVLPHQIKNTLMSEAIDQVQTLLAKPKVLAPNGCITQWTNAVEVLPCNTTLGTPMIIPGASLPPDYYQEKERNKANAYELAGVSQASASATRVEGLPSARAQREQADMASGRLVLHAQREERWLAENGRVATGLMRRAYKGNRPKEVRAPNTALLLEVDWDAFDVIEDEAQVRAFITSAIPTTGAGRDEVIAEQVQAGIINPRRAVRMYASPDIERWEDLESAAEDLALKMIESALGEGKYIPPEPVMGADGLAALIELGGKELMRALLLKEPPSDDNVELLRRLIAEAELMAKPAAQPAAAPTAPMPAPPANDNGAPAPRAAAQ